MRGRPPSFPFRRAAAAFFLLLILPSATAAGFFIRLRPVEPLLNSSTGSDNSEGTKYGLFPSRIARMSALLSLAPTSAEETAMASSFPLAVGLCRTSQPSPRSLFRPYLEKIQTMNAFNPEIGNGRGTVCRFKRREVSASRAFNLRSNTKFVVLFVHNFLR